MSYAIVNIIMMIAGFLFLMALAFIIWNYVGPFCISYRLTPGRIEIKFFNLIPVHSVNISDAIDVREIKTAFPNLVIFFQFTNRAFVKSYVLIKVRRGLLRQIRLTPNNPSSFIEQVKRFQKQ